MAEPARGQSLASLTERPLVTPVGRVDATLWLEVDLTSNYVGQPTSLAPDVTVGIAQGWSLGLIHSSSAMGLADAGNGLCLTGDEGGCPRVYRNVGLEARWAVGHYGAAELAVTGQLVARRFDPFRLSVRPGALLRVRYDWFAFVAWPEIAVGLTHVDEGNRHFLNLPLRFQFQIVEPLAVELVTGLRGTFATFSDTYTIPLGLGFRARVHERVEVRADATWSRMWGPLNTFFVRRVTLGVMARF